MVGLGPWSPVTHEGDTRCGFLSHSRLDRPVAFPEDGIRGQGKAVGTETPPTALLFGLSRMSASDPKQNMSGALGIGRRTALLFDKTCNNN